MKKVQVVWHSVFHHLLNLLRELEKEVDDVQILVLKWIKCRFGMRTKDVTPKRNTCVHLEGHVDREIE